MGDPDTAKLWRAEAIRSCAAKAKREVEARQQWQAIKRAAKQATKGAVTAANASKTTTTLATFMHSESAIASPTMPPSVTTASSMVSVAAPDSSRTQPQPTQKRQREDDPTEGNFNDEDLPATLHPDVYGANVIKPNHHYATHTADNVRNYGPLFGFWTFLFERLNKVLKSYKTNNHSGGELEVTFFREFHRSILTSRMVCWLN